MLQTLKFNTRDQGIFFSSDFHFNHRCENWEVPLWKQRGFNSVTASDDYIVNTLNDLVGPSDFLFHLGDFCLTSSESQVEELLSRIKCQNIFTLWGNHPAIIKDLYFKELNKVYNTSNNEFDYCGLKRSVEVYPLRYRNLIFLGDYAEIAVNGKLIILNHYPLSIWNHSKNGAFCCSGHSHGGHSNTLKDHKNGKSLDVGWDVWKKPLGFGELKSIMDTKDIAKGLDKHH